MCKGLQKRVRQIRNLIVCRTHAGIHFFTQKVENLDEHSWFPSKEKGQAFDDAKHQSESHHDVMSRILFTFAKVGNFHIFSLPDMQYV
jgi:hypothetical protein